MLVILTPIYVADLLRRSWVDGAQPSNVLTPPATLADTVCP